MKTHLLMRAGLFVAIAALAGCTHTDAKLAASANIEWTEPNKRVVLMDPDISLGEVTAGGMVETRADWTKSAKEFVEGDIRRKLLAKGVDVVDVGTLDNAHAVQLIKLQDAVGTAIRLHLYIAAYKLPNKGDALDWTLGSGTNDLRDKFGADYALFTNVRDSYTTTGRALVMFGAAMFGVGIQGGSQSGFASLVDLRTGNIVWFNQMASGSGDLRTEKPAQDSVNSLIAGLPL